MIARLCLIFVLLSAGLMAKELARSCSQRATKPCKAIVIRESVVWYLVPGDDRSYERKLGPYVAEVQDIVAQDEAPVRRFAFSNGWFFVQTWGFQSEYPFAGPIAHFYFFSPDGTLFSKVLGDIRIDDLLHGDVLGTGTEMLIVSLSGGPAIAVTTRVWMMTPAGPRKVLDLHGRLVRVERSQGLLNLPGLIVRQVTTGEGGHDDFWRDVFYKWNESAGEFEGQGGTDEREK